MNQSVGPSTCTIHSAQWPHSPLPRFMETFGLIQFGSICQCIVKFIDERATQNNDYGQYVLDIKLSLSSDTKWIKKIAY